MEPAQHSSSSFFLTVHVSRRVPSDDTKVALAWFEHVWTDLNCMLFLYRTCSGKPSLEISFG
jgi:hypothetical protein